jgi:hypothetical protein
MTRLFLALLAVVALCGCTPAPSRPVVVWISIDGFRPDYLDHANAPTLKRLIAQGESSRQLVPPMPSLTFPSHVTQVTGVLVRQHGIPANSFYDATTKQLYKYPNDERMLEAEPIWRTAQRQGVRALVQDWPLSFEPGETFDAERSDQQRLDELLDTWRRDRGRPSLRLIMSYIKNIDVVGHEHGPDAPETRAAVERVDAQVKWFIDKATQVLRQQKRHGNDLYLVLTSDHGMTPVRTRVSAESLFARPPPPSVERVSGGTFAMLHLDRVPAAERDALQASLLADLWRWDFLDVYTRDRLPPEWGLAHPTRVGDIVIVLRPGYLLTDRQPRGAHGYVPAECPDMNGLCVIWRYPSHAARRDLGRIDGAQMHATVARLLGIQPSPAAAPPVK